MIIDCVSDLHGYYPKLDGGDLLIVAGDLTASDTEHQMMEFCAWLRNQEYEQIILVAGNHDNYLQKNICLIEYLEDSGEFEYLCDSGSEFRGFKIWGSPWTRTFDGMNPVCKAFTFDTEEELEEKFKLIPSDVDILVTHSPPFAILDRTLGGTQVGSTALMKHHLTRFNPKVWVWGHIHEAYGKDNHKNYVNASHVDRWYKPVNPPIRVTL